MTDKEPYIITQLDEALEERQCRDRRKRNADNDIEPEEDRRSGDRRDNVKRA